jgi:hypothetical protein
MTFPATVLTVAETRSEAEAAALPPPTKRARSSRTPAGSSVVVNEAEPEESVAAPSIASPSQNVTFPAAPAGETVAVSVTGEPKVETAGETESVVLEISALVSEKVAATPLTDAVTA